MRRVVIIFGFSCVVGLALGMIGMQYLTAQQLSIKRTDVLKTDMAGMEGKEANMWVAEIAPGAATGEHVWWKKSADSIVLQLF